MPARFKKFKQYPSEVMTLPLKMSYMSCEIQVKLLKENLAMAAYPLL